jgi:type IV pilus assembly protein PilC
MPKFEWEGTNERGELRTGEMEAANRQAVEKALLAEKIKVIGIKKRGGGVLAKLSQFSKVKTKTLVVFTRQLATMIDAGLPLVQCLEILSTQEPDPGFKVVLTEVKGSVEHGNTFADSLKKHPKVFDNLFVNLVAAGEMGGILDTILNRLADYSEKSAKLASRIKGAMKYPMTVLIVSFVITGGLLWKVVPTFASMFKSLGNRELPAVTQFLVVLSNNFIKFMPLIAGIIVGLIVLWKTIRKYETSRYISDKIFTKMPIFGNLIVKSSIAKFTRTLGTLIASGVPILDAMEIVAKTSGNLVVERGVLYARDRVAEGKTIAGPLMEQRLFPKMVIQMIAVGESTGALDVMLTKIADFYDDEVDEAVDGVTSMMEPLIMVVLGGIVGTVMIGMYAPIFSMADGMTGAK